MNWRTRPRKPAPDACDTILSLLSLQADGMASADESGRVESHLAACEGCRRAQRWMQATHLAIAQRPLVAPPADLRARIAQAVAAQATPVAFTTRRPFVLRPAFAAAASLVLVAAWLGHSLLTTHAPTKHVAILPPTVSVVPPSVSPTSTAKTVAKAVSAPRPTSVRRAPVNVKKTEEMAEARPAVALREIAPEPTAPAVRPTSRPKSISHPALLALGPTEPAPAPIVKSRPITHVPSIIHVARVPKPVVPVVPPDVTPPPVSPAPAPTVVAVKPDDVATPIPAPAPVRVAHREDVLSDVRAHLTSSHSDAGLRQISRNRDSGVRAASYSPDESLTPYYGMVYTPTHEEH